MQQALAPQEKLQFPEKLEDEETRTKWQKKKQIRQKTFTAVEGVIEAIRLTPQRRT